VTERTPYHLNVIGPFYVEDGCCTTCDVPIDNAPELFEYDENQCYVKQQPRTREELDRMLLVMRSQELGCIRYRDNDPEILGRLTDLGAATSCDRISAAPPPAVPDEVTFHAVPLLMTTEIVDALAARVIELTRLSSGRWQLRHAGNRAMAETIQRWLTADASIVDVHWTTAAERAIGHAGRTKPF
jgi:hypothetical protein